MKLVLFLAFCLVAASADDLDVESTTPQAEESPSISVSPEKLTTGVGSVTTAPPSLKGEVTPLLSAFTTPAPVPNASSLSNGLTKPPRRGLASLQSPTLYALQNLLQQYGLGLAPILPQAVVPAPIVAQDPIPAVIAATPELSSRLGQPARARQLQASLLSHGLAPTDSSGLGLPYERISQGLLQPRLGLASDGLEQVPIGYQLVSTPVGISPLALNRRLSLERSILGGYNPGLISGGWSGLQGLTGNPGDYGLSRFGVWPGLGGDGLIKKK